MTAARHESVRLGAGYIGHGHILLALLSDRAFGAVRVLAHVGVDVGRLREEAGKVAPRGDAPPTEGQVPFSPDSKAFIEAAAAMAVKLGHDKITSSHFLLGDLGDPRGLLPRILNGLDLDLADIRHKVWEALAKPDSA
ncbi:MAG TPA: Clp protease N-terminal domain-containing protein [Planctomycetota bacterium]|nr:Clp protease N-terminal domain-containing protein [Planctomycetota bacterium]